MTTQLFADSQDLLGQRRLERGLEPAPPRLVSARRLLLTGGVIGTAALGCVLGAWALILLRNQMLSVEIARLGMVPAQLQALELKLRSEKSKLEQQSKSTEALARGLVAVSSGSALMTQFTRLTPQGVQITDLGVSGQALSLKGRADDPGAFTRINALSLLLAYDPLFKPDAVRVLKLNRESMDASKATARPGMMWELAAGLAQLKSAQQLPLLRKLGADGMATRLQDLQRMGILP